ncbi:hypothetical protein Vadar_005446 [Vaccinium darrowii]|uniref:Uncharacterized protein n=1 Tax=Vaccinium darrowii TaxID=229202 RepID=A0ACB7XWS0_9ERIC|nr:hypothetical protein Vadar_005446 [Vaccinium darrowii]
MASSSKSPSAQHGEDLSEQSVPNEVLLSKGEQKPYPYPEHLKVEELVPITLDYPFSFLVEAEYVEWNKKYVEWRQKMLDVITRAGLLGFIDGTVQAPPKTVTTSVNGLKGGNTTHEERENEEYVAWKRSDDLVREWIRNRLAGLMSSVFGRYETAKEIWEGIAGPEKDFRLFHYLELYKAAIKGDWETADKFIQKEPDAVRARITVDSETALIVAVKRVGGKDFVEKLVEKMSPDDLAICDNGGRTALHRAAGFGNIEVAKLLVEKNQALLDMETHSKERALFYAAERGDRKLVDWLMELTNLYTMSWDLEFRILYQLTHSQLYDIALKLLKHASDLAYCNMEEEDLKFHALATLAGTPSSFKSGNNFNFQQEFIYSRMKIKKNEGMELENTADNHSRGDIEAPLASNNSGAVNGEILNLSPTTQPNSKATKTAPVITTTHSSPEKISMTAAVVTKKDGGERMTMEFILPSKYKAAKEAPRPVDERVVMREESSHHSYEAEVDEDGEEYDEGDDDVDFLESERGWGRWAYAVRKKLHALFSKVIETLFDQILIIKPIREIREKKLLHNQALDLLKFLCETAVNSRNYFEADRNFRLPLERATSTGIHEIVEEILRVYPYAVYLENDKKQSIFQQAIVFRQEKVFNLIYQYQESRAMVLSKGDDCNNNALHLAGQVAYPVQAYRRPNAALQMQSEMQWFKEVERLVLPKNREERNRKGKTPAQVFSDEHRELVEKGEKWMKDTASSCTIIASIIATVAFAAALQVPGGNNNNGLPNLNQQTAFTIFGIFNESALFSSIASLILFLSVLSSRYAEEDFLVILPSKLILGLAWLILSILFTMTAFGAAL